MDFHPGGDLLTVMERHEGGMKEEDARYESEGMGRVALRLGEEGQRVVIDGYVLLWKGEGCSGALNVKFARPKCGKVAPPPPKTIIGFIEACQQK